MDYLKCARKNNNEEWNEICECNDIFGINRVAFESSIDREILRTEGHAGGS